MRSIREMDGRIDASLRLSLTARITRSNNYAGTIDTGFLDLEWIDILLILLAGVTIRSRDTHGIKEISLVYWTRGTILKKRKKGNGKRNSYAMRNIFTPDKWG